MLTISAVLGLTTSAAYAPWPVWRDSARSEVKFFPLSKKEAARRWHRARRHESATHEPGKHGGAIGRTGLAVLYTLLFDFLDYRTGRLDPSYEGIARKAGCCRRAAVTAVKRLRDLGMIHWQRRCLEDTDELGRFRLRQETNAYAVLPPSHWRGVAPEPEPPEPWQLGAVPPLPDAIGQAVAEIAGGQHRAALSALEAAPGDKLAEALARLGRLIG